MTTPPIRTLDGFKLSATFSDDGVVHQRAGADDEVWTEVDVIGRGGQGTVYLQQRHPSPLPLFRAVKKLSKELMRASAVDVMRELTTMMALSDHEDLFVKLFGWFEDPRGNIFLAMEYLPHGDLAAYIKSDAHARGNGREVTRQLLAGLSILHSRHICHRDLKPQNILVASLVPIRVKLADFGISKSTVGTNLRTRFGTVHYMAPERLGLLPKTLRPGNEYTTAVDMWALGFIVHELLTGETLFQESTLETTLSEFPSVTEPEEVTTDMDMLVDFCRGTTELPLELLEAIGASDSAIRFIKRLIVADPRARTKASEALLDPWILDHPPHATRQRHIVTDQPQVEVHHRQVGMQHPQAPPPATEPPADRLPDTVPPPADCAQRSVEAPTDSPPEPRWDQRELAVVKRGLEHIVAKLPLFAGRFPDTVPPPADCVERSVEVPSDSPPEPRWDQRELAVVKRGIGHMVAKLPSFDGRDRSPDTVPPPPDCAQISVEVPSDSPPEPRWDQRELAVVKRGIGHMVARLPSFDGRDRSPDTVPPPTDYAQISVEAPSDSSPEPSRSRLELEAARRGLGQIVAKLPSFDGKTEFEKALDLVRKPPWDLSRLQVERQEWNPKSWFRSQRGKSM